MKQSIHKIALLLVVIVIFICTLISVSYAYYVVSSEEDKVDFDVYAELPSKCTSVQITDEKPLSISGDYALPVEDSRLLNSSEEVLSNYRYTFTVTNECDAITNVKISIAPLIESTMPIDAMRYALVKSGKPLPKQGNFINRNNGYRFSEQIKSDASLENGYNINVGYEIQSVNLSAHQSETYDLYIWIDYYEGDRTETGQNNGVTMNKDFMATLIIFDYINPSSGLLADHIKSLYSSDGVNDLYLHDGVGTYENADLEAGDNSYRYAGANPNNFVCFGDDCTNYDNLYRIIGVFGDQVKLIKADFANSNLLGENGDYSSEVYTPSTNATFANYLTRGKLTTINRYYWNKASGTNKNIWNDSELNKTNLNKNFLDNIGNAYSSMIAPTQWIVSGFPSFPEIPLNAQNVYKYEIAETCAECGPDKETRLLSEPTKIGLMYVSDYMYSASPTYWEKERYNVDDATEDYRAAIEENWLYLGISEWAISPCLSYDNYVFFVVNNGRVGAYTVYDNTYGVRPSFYLKENISYAGGTGTVEDPIRIGQTLSNYITESYSADGINDLYYHDGTGTYTNSNLEAGDGSYRYSGADPNNFVCFGDDCTNYDNLYRIIGVFGDKVKLIKADFANSNLLGTDGDYNTSTYSASSYAEYLKRGKLTTINKYYWNKVSGTNKNIWSDSELNKTNLNKNFVEKLESTYLSMIDDTTQWIVSGAPWSEITSTDNNAKRTYNYEISETCDYCGTSKETRLLSEPAKIGLMYVSDYMYAAAPNNWTLSGYNSSDATQDYRAVIEENWLYLGAPEWTVSRDSTSTNLAFYVGYTGYVDSGFVYYFSIGVRPSFFLLSSVKYNGGSGSATDPICVRL